MLLYFTEASTETVPAGAGFGVTMLLYAGIMVVFWVLLIRPNRKEQKQKAQIMASLAVQRLI